MQLYWLFLVMAMIGVFVCEIYPRYIKINGQYEPRARFWQALILFGVVILFCGLRSGIADTPAIFKNLMMRFQVSRSWILIRFKKIKGMQY